MKVVFLASYAPSLENFRAELIDAILSAGHSVSVIAPEINCHSATKDWLEKRNIDYHQVPMVRNGANPFLDIVCFWKIFLLLREVSPDVLIAYTVKPVLWGTIAARLASVPIRAPLITGLGFAFTPGNGAFRYLIQYILRGLYWSSLRCATLIFFQNPDDSADFRRMGLIPKAVPVKIVDGSGVSLKKFPRQRLPSGRFSFVLIARLLEDKGIREYAAAARIVHRDWQEVEFHLVGGIDSNPSGIPRSEVYAWHQAGDLIWHGQLDDVGPMLAQASAYVLPSYREGLPRTVLEAMATCRPIITTDAPGCRETVVDGINGFLVPPRDSVALAQAMIRMLELPRSELARMANASYDMVVRRFDVDKVNRSMISFVGL